MSAYLELRQTGRLGTAGAELLYATTAAVIRFDRLPPPGGAARWSTEAVRELAHDFLTDDRTPHRLETMLRRASDDDSLARLLEAAVRNYIRDRLRQSDHGAFRRRLREVLEQSDRVAQATVPGEEAWVTPAIAPDLAAWSGDPKVLDAAAWSVEAPLLRWRSEHRRDPITEPDALAEVCEAVIEAAEKPVTTSTLVEVGLRRFALARTPDVVDLSDEPGSPDVDLAELVSARQEALTAFQQLSPRERQMLTVWDQPIRQVADAIGLGRSATAVAVRRLEATLTELLDPLEDSDTIWQELQHLAHTWLQVRTARPDVSSDQSEGGTTS